MAHDDTPEDLERSFPCPCGGSIKFREDIWECDTCDWNEVNNKPANPA